VAFGFPKVVKVLGRGANDMCFVTACEKQFPIIVSGIAMTSMLAPLHQV
jgi:hypothetical protein